MSQAVPQRPLIRELPTKHDWALYALVAFAAGAASFTFAGLYFGIGPTGLHRLDNSYRVFLRLFTLGPVLISALWLFCTNTFDTRWVPYAFFSWLLAWEAVVTYLVLRY